MQLPNCELAIIPEPKITKYLLSESHRDGRHKAAFFLRFGYTLPNWTRLRDDLLKQATCEATCVQRSPFGARYVIEGIIDAPDGRQPRIRTVWFIGNDSDIPRLATAYPAE
jgi:hypothetical protein